MRVGGLFDGIGLLAYGLHLAGLEHEWLCEVDPWRRSILHKRFPGVPVFDDVRSVGAHNAEPVHVVAGGFPCKGASAAGKQEGFGHPETVLWREMARTVRELRPRYVIVENVAFILGLHDGAVWGEVVGDLAALGYRVEWDVFPAAAFGAPHLRERVFAVASHTDGQGVEGHGGSIGVRAQVPGVDSDGAGAASDSAYLGSERGWRAREGRVGSEDGGSASSDAECGVHRHSGSGDIRGAAGAGEGEAPQRERVRSDASDGVGTVEWGAFEPAIRRWEAIHGPAPEPLVRRVDDRSSARVVRSRLSALGDGVQVQVGQLVGEYVMSLERERVS